MQGKPRNPALAKWRREAVNGGRWRKVHTADAIARLERRLCNSVAHVVKPRPADFDRWEAMRDRIDALRTLLAGFHDGEEPPEIPASILPRRSMLQELDALPPEGKSDRAGAALSAAKRGGLSDAKP
jgi:hypothetical protein